MLSERNASEVDMKKEKIIKKLRENGCRMTRQREVLLDIILEEACSSSKEIYYKAASRSKGIGPATVYRMIDLLEKQGFITREKMYSMTDLSAENVFSGMIRIELDDGTVIDMSSEKVKNIIRLGLKAEGYIKEQNIKNIKKHEVHGIAQDTEFIDKISQ